MSETYRKTYNLTAEALDRLDYRIEQLRDQEGVKPAPARIINEALMKLPPRPPESTNGAPRRKRKPIATARSA